MMRRKLLHRMKEVYGATSRMMKDELIVVARTSSGWNPAFNLYIIFMHRYIIFCHTCITVR